MKAEQMRATLSRWKESNLSLRAFGAREGVSYSKLVYWRRRLSSDSQAAQKPDLAPVKIVTDREVSTSSASPVSVWLPNGISLEVPPGSAIEEVSRLVDALSRC